MKEAHVIAAGFPEMWEQVYTKYKYFFDCAAKLEPIICDVSPDEKWLLYTQLDSAVDDLMLVGNIR
jgi:hypothetical protein